MERARAPIFNEFAGGHVTFVYRRIQGRSATLRRYSVHVNHT